ncbi:MAG TPA: TolC family protein [Planctomycetaceae bacterium]|nr:TolC family protein [Planctomycetaceae bacterium]
MRARSPKRILRFIAILAAALGGCQTAGTAPDSSRLAMGTRLSTGAISAVRTDTGPPPAEAADGTPPRVELTLDAGDRSTPASATGDDSPTKHLVADFTVATTVPAGPAPSDSRPAAPVGQSAGADGDSVPQTPLVASAPSAPGGPGPSADAGTVPLTLDTAIATSLDRNDTLVTLRAGEPVARAMLDVAEHYPYNPYIKAEVLPYARDPFGNLLAVRNTVYILQSLELAHQQRYREASAQAALNQVRWNVVAAELTTLATTEKLFFTALYQRDLRDLAQRAATLNEELAADVEHRFKSGLAKPGEDTTARVSLRQSQKQAALAEANYKLALLALERQLNIVGERPFELVGRLEDFQWLPIDGMGSAPGEVQSSAQLAQTLADERPDVRAAQAGTTVAQSNADLARANTVQNIQFGPYYERDEFETLFFGFAAQMNLPIWDSGKPLARQREAECTQKVIGLNALRMRARVEVQTALERYQRARNLAEKEHSNLVQSLSGDLGRIKRQFEAGQADILNVFATQTALLQEQKAYLDLLNELGQAAADVTLTAGLPPARVTSGPRTEAPPPAPPPAS